MANIVITGANQGIGYYLVEQLLNDGNRAAVFDLETENLKKLKAKYGDKLLCYVVDVRDQEQLHKAVRDIVSKFESIDIAIHDACVCTFQAEADTQLDVYSDVLDVNFFGALRLAKSVLPYMRKQNHGKVIFTSSGVGVTGFSKISPYASSKGAIEALAKCLKIEYAKDNISFHIFHPPLTRTKSADPLPVPKEFKALPDKVGYGLAKHIYSKRFIICHSLWQKVQVMGLYFFPLKMGYLLSKMTGNYDPETNSNS